MHSPRKYDSPAMRETASKAAGMFQNRLPHTGSGSIWIQKILPKLGDLKFS